MKGTVMIFRLSFLIALLVGLGGLFHVYPLTSTLRDVHILAGLIMWVAVIWMAVETRSPLVMIAAALILAAGLIALVSTAEPLSIRLFHLVIMLVAVGMTEMGVARAVRKSAV